MPKAQTLACRVLFAIFFALPAWQPGLIFGQNASRDFEALSRDANAARAEGNSTQAISDYERALKIQPQWPEGWWYLGTLYADAGRFADAIAVFTKLTEANPKLGPAWASLGLSEFAVRDYQNSLAHLRQAQELGFADVPYLERPATYHLALLLNLNGEFEDAFGSLAPEFGKEGLTQETRVAMGMSLLRVPLLPGQVDPSKDALLADAGDAAELLATANFEQAFQTFQRMLKQYPNTPYLHYAYGSAIGRVTALTYGESADDPGIRQFGIARAEAMAFRDARGQAITEADWTMIESRLGEAYRLLKASVSR